MSIKIEKITAKYLGPDKKDININFKNVNLIYSKNEGGKSLLVEFIIRCLFKKPDEFGHIRNSGTGKLLLSGLNDKLFEFSTSSKQKLENILEKEFQELPITFSKLLIVKSGEVELIKEKNNYSGINKNIIKELLSPQKILDKIINNLPVTAKDKDTEIKDKIINASRKGEFKTYYETINKYENIVSIINKIVNEYNTIEYNEIKIREKQLEEERQKLLKAKRYKAYKLSVEIQELKESLQKIPEDRIKYIENKLSKYKELRIEINKLQKDINEKIEILKDLPEIEQKFEEHKKAKKFLAYKIYQQIQEKEIVLQKLSHDKLNKLQNYIELYHETLEEFNKLEIRINELKQKTKDFEWLEANIDKLYQLMQLQDNSKIKVERNLIHIIALILGLTGLITGLFLNKFVAGLLLIFIAFLILLTYKFNIKKIVKEEILTKFENDIKKSFQEKFDTKFSYDKIEEIHKELLNKKNELQLLEKQFIEKEQTLKNKKYQIEELFYTLIDIKPKENEWNKELKIIIDKRDKTEQEKKLLEQQFNKLDIDQTDFIKEDNGITYQKEELEKLEKKLNELKSIENAKHVQEKELTEKTNLINELIQEIKKEFTSLLNEDIDENQFEANLEKLKSKISQIKEKLNNIEGELQGLGISEKDYISEQIDVEYSNDRMRDIEKSIEEIKGKVLKIDENINSLKNEICKITNDDFTTDFNTLLNNLYKKEIEVKNELTNLESKLAAQIITYKAIAKLQEEEDKKIIEVLESEDFSNLLFKFTGKYKKLTIKNDDQDKDKIYISSDIEEYPLDDISTGTKEQVLLALRIAFAKRLLKNKSAFLVLDDAFQHSDYDRRELLIHTIYEIANNGWQVIYLTMDDHIKKTFEEKAKLFNNDLNLINLNENN